MVNQELVKQLLKALEAEKGSPVQITVNTPESMRWAEGCGEAFSREHFGQFEDRGVIVKRIESIEPEYEHDVSLIEGKYPSLNDLQRKIKEYNVLYEHPSRDTSAGRAFQLVQEATKKQLMHNNLACNFSTKKDEGDKTTWNFRPLCQEGVEKILQDNGVAYFKHNIIARPNGVYDDRTSYGSLSMIDETKIADITLKLIE